MANQPKGRAFSLRRRFLDNEAAGGLVLMAAAALALIVANSPLAGGYEAALHLYIGPLSLQHWINDGLMAVFFLLVGLEIKREVLDGQLSTWPRRALPGIAAVAGMAVPGLVYVALNLDDPALLRGWAIPSATDIAFALGVISLLGSRVPASLKLFLTALAIIDDLGAVLVIALFYTADISGLALGLAAATAALLVGLNRLGVTRLLPYLVLGATLWVFVFLSGVHATIAGVVLAFTIPLNPTPARPDDMARSPLHRLEHALHRPVAFLVVPVFGFANAGVSLAGVDAAALLDGVTLGIAAGLFWGKIIGVFGAAWLTVRLGLADLPMGAGWGQMLGVSALCGIGFTMSLFIGLLAFPGPEMQERVKLGILAGSLLSGVVGYAILRFAPRDVPAPGSPEWAALRGAPPPPPGPGAPPRPGSATPPAGSRR